MKCKIYCWNARGEIYLNPVFILMMQVSWGAQRQIFARAGGTSCSQHCHISVLSTREAILTTTCVLPIITEHFATLGTGSGALVPTLLPPVPARWLDSHLEHSQRHLEPARALEDVSKNLRGSGTNSCEGGHEGMRVLGALGSLEAVERARA